MKTQRIRNLSFIEHSGRKIPKVPAQLHLSDWIGTAKVRCGIGRMNYAVDPGLYAVGDPDGDSPVFVSANYKLSFDALRKELGGLDGWILVLDTKGVNVWCSAGKGTFGTDEIVNRVGIVGLETIVNHRRLILPQLGAVGVAAHKVKSGCGFSVVYGPIRACDIVAFMQAGMKATDQMRQVRFSFYDRLVLLPVEFVAGAKYVLFAMALFFIMSGISARGYSSGLALHDGVRSMFNLFAAYAGGAGIGPLFLPWLPGRSFSFKGLMAGLLVGSVLALLGLVGSGAEKVAWLFLVAAIASFVTMNFTGASTYTSLSGVKKEMRVAVPLQIAAAALGLGLWIIGRFV
ncbi:MAG: hypothetical protein JSU70_11050 [Phycisphaerales bacterium]|nr:MAG: hypothetical protein JSU70_11050 [Phycisphaerales bacterium]